MQKSNRGYTQNRDASRQLILLNDDGYIIASCDSIFSTQELRDRPIFYYFPLLESIFDSITKLKPHSPALRFSKVEPTFPELSGFFDYTFIRTDIDRDLPIMWTINDYTHLYNDYQRTQQQLNELELAKQLLESLN